MLGYALGLPASIAVEIVVRSYYALKDAYTPLVFDILALAARFGLMLLFLKVLAGPYVILAIPVASSVSVTAQTIMLGSMLFLRLRKKIKTDKGLERLKRMRARNLQEQDGPLRGEHEAVEVEVQ